MSLMWVFGFPFLAALLMFALARGRDWLRLAFLLSLVPMVLLLLGFQESVEKAWLPQLGINFSLGVDALSKVFLYLTALIVPLSFFAIKRGVKYPNVFYGLILLLQGLLIGFFTAKDLVFFTVFFEAMLLPVYFIISLWGGSEKKEAALTFILYTVAGSALMVAAVIGLYVENQTFDLEVLRGVGNKPVWLFAIFMLAFAVKTPLFPFHGWLPIAYTEAPAAGTILLSGLLSKAGIYGFFRIGQGLFPELLGEWSPSFLALAITGVLYGGFAAWRQQDFKRLLAYSSFSHVNFILAGLFVLTQVSHQGALLQVLNHSVTMTALFLVAWWLEVRLGSRLIRDGGGLTAFVPKLGWFTLFFVLASVALPGTNNFVGEFLIFFGLFSKSPWLTALLGFIVILSVVYMLRWMQLVYYGEPNFFKNHLQDIKAKEVVQLSLLVALVLWIGIYPATVLKEIEPAVQIENRPISKFALLEKIEHF